ncbi:Hypothetical protein PBC10988_16470 [Planctomycetales bacterium 10988]|nr:Hypothetical protein PBC10988_16470 [Planctomycetales bacterium 10988]
MSAPVSPSGPSSLDRSKLDLEIGVIYTYERSWMDPLLATMRDSLGDHRAGLLLVDNRSGEDVREWETYFPSTKVIQNASRLGYAENLNRILAASKAPLILLLNTDIYFQPENQCLAKMIRFMHEHPTCGLSTCRAYHPDGTYGYPARKFQSLRAIAGRRLGLEFLFRGDVDDYLFRHRDPEDTFECDWVSGCWMLVRRETFETIGGFDTIFGKYFEDVDYCLRVRQAGWRVMMHGQGFFYHYEQRASTNLFTKDAWQHGKSYLKWLRKWGPNPQKVIDRAPNKPPVAPLATSKKKRKAA